MINKLLTLFILILITTSACSSNESNSIVVKITDGDTIRFIQLNDSLMREEFKGRLYGIDAPELYQEFGKESKEYLSKLLLDKPVHIQIVNTDFYGRKVIRIYLNNQYINNELVKNGYAWSYREYNNNDKLLNESEIHAQHNKLGLWEFPNPIRPSDWRKKHRQLDVFTSNINCDYTLNCTNLTSCEKAKYLLSTCNFFHLDRNGNGIPCENLCK